MLGTNFLSLLRQSKEVLPLAEFGGQPIELFEYMALKQEQSARLTLRETALYANLAVLLALLAARVQAVVVLDDKVMLLLPYLAGIMFWIYFNNDYYINRISAYIVQYLAPRLHKQILAHGDSSIGAQEPGSPDTHLVNQYIGGKYVFAWEHLHRTKSYGRRLRKTANVAVLLVSYVLAPVMILALVSQHPMVGLVSYEWVGGAVIIALTMLGIVSLGV